MAKDAVAGAHGVIAVTPIFSASYNGLFKTFFDLLDEFAASVAAHGTVATVDPFTTPPTPFEQLLDAG